MSLRNGPSSPKISILGGALSTGSVGTVSSTGVVSSVALAVVVSAAAGASPSGSTSSTFFSLYCASIALASADSIGLSASLIRSKTSRSSSNLVLIFAALFKFGSSFVPSSLFISACSLFKRSPKLCKAANTSLEFLISWIVSSSAPVATASLYAFLSPSKILDTFSIFASIGSTGTSPATLSAPVAIPSGSAKNVSGPSVLFAKAFIASSPPSVITCSICCVVNPLETRSSTTLTAPLAPKYPPNAPKAPPPRAPPAAPKAVIPASLPTLNSSRSPRDLSLAWVAPSIPSSATAEYLAASIPPANAPCPTPVSLERPAVLPPR